ncbi:hypothetical protein J2R96_002054 [Bradyrhizobium elkanii]|nr:hypothetical protein [Bradyrhizobium elkanii]
MLEVYATVGASAAAERLLNQIAGSRADIRHGRLKYSDADRAGWRKQMAKPNTKFFDPGWAAMVGFAESAVGLASTSLSSIVYENLRPTRRSCGSLPSFDMDGMRRSSS